MRLTKKLATLSLSLSGRERGRVSLPLFPFPFQTDQVHVEAEAMSVPSFPSSPPLTRTLIIKVGFPLPLSFSWRVPLVGEKGDTPPFLRRGLLRVVQLPPLCVLNVFKRELSKPPLSPFFFSFLSGGASQLLLSFEKERKSPDSTFPPPLLFLLPAYEIKTNDCK